MADEQVVADAAKAVEAKADAGAGSGSGKMYSEEELKAVITERDKAKHKLRAIEELEKKTAENKAIEDGRLKEVLASKEAELTEARKIVDSVRERDNKLRETLTNKLTEPIDKKVAAKLDIEELSEYVESKQHKVSVFNANAQPGQVDNTPAKNMAEYMKKLNRMGYEQF